MDVKVLPTRDEFDARAAETISQRVQEKPDLIAALPTGSSPVGMYRELVRRVQAGHLSLAQVTAINLDELVGVGADHPQSYAFFMRRHLTGSVPVARHLVPDGAAADPDAEAARYEQLVAAAGRIDLAVVGVGANGHVGFNEPGSPLDSRTRVVELTEETRRAQASLFGSVAAVPRLAISLGVANLLEAREVLVLATGSGKERALRALLAGPVATELPISALRLHPRVTVLVTADLASSAGIPLNHTTL